MAILHEYFSLDATSQFCCLPFWYVHTYQGVSMFLFFFFFLLLFFSRDLLDRGESSLGTKIDSS